MCTIFSVFDNSQGGFVGVKVFYMDYAPVNSNYSFESHSGSVTLASTVVFMKCDVKTGLGEQKDHIMKTEL